MGLESSGPNNDDSVSVGISPHDLPNAKVYLQLIDVHLNREGFLNLIMRSLQRNAWC